MIELIVMEFIEQRLNVPVRLEYPEDPPESFVILKRESNPRENQLDSAMIVADSYGKSLLEAAQLNEEVKAAMDDLVTLSAVCSSTRSGDYPAFDIKNKKHRYQAVQNITHY